MKPIKEDSVAAIRVATQKAIADLTTYDMGAREYSGRAEHLRRVLVAIESPIPWGARSKTRLR